MDEKSSTATIYSIETFWYVTFEATITREDALELARNFRFRKQEVLPKGP